MFCAKPIKQDLVRPENQSMRSHPPRAILFIRGRVLLNAAVIKVIPYFLGRLGASNLTMSNFLRRSYPLWMLAFYVSSVKVHWICTY